MVLRHLKEKSEGMRADMPCKKLRHMRALVWTMAIILPLFFFTLGGEQPSRAVSPSFTRPNVLVDKGPGWVETTVSGGPVVVTDTSGIIHAAWSDNKSGVDKGIYYSRSLDCGLTWVGEQRIDGFPGLNNIEPSIASDKSGGTYDGNVYISWQLGESSLGDVYSIRSADGGNTWQNKVRVDTAGSGVESSHPQVAVDTDGRVYVAFQDERSLNFDIYVSSSGDGGVTWSPNIVISGTPNTDSYPSIAANDGTVYVAWQEVSSTGTQLWLASSIDGGNGWQSGVIISRSSSSGELRFISITVDSTQTMTQTLHTVWVMADSPAPRYIAYAQTSDRGASWSTPVKVNDVVGTSSYMPNSPTIVQSMNVLYAIWSDNRNGDTDIFASWSEDYGKTWGDGLANNNDVRVDDTDQNVNPGDDVTAQVSSSATPSAFGVYAIWSDRRNPPAYHAYFAGFDVSELLITEVRDSPNGAEEVELFNYGGKSIDLAGWILRVDGMGIDLSPLGVVAPSTYLTIGDPASCNLVMDVTLGDEGGIVELFDPLVNLRDSVSYGQLGPAPDPVQLESVARVMSGTEYSNFWTRAAATTFGAANVVRPPIRNSGIVLNEILFNAANPDSRFIELYFRSLGAIDLTGFMLVGDAYYVLPSVSLSDMNPYYILRPSQAPSVFLQMDVSGDNLYLYDPGGALLDMVGWTSSHSQDMSMARVPEGNGTADGYNDVTSALAGWKFDQTPSLPLVLIVPRQSKKGDLGDRVFYVLYVTNKEPEPVCVNIEATRGSQGWQMTLFQGDGIAPLADSLADLDSIPDTGLLQPDVPLSIQVSVDIPWKTQFQDWELSSVTATVASDPLASASVSLLTSVNPYVSPDAYANPSTIWVDDSPPSYQPKETRIGLSMTGRGTPVLKPRPQDTVLMIDSSGSMAQNDPGNLRKSATKHYVDLLSIPDRAAVVDFDEDAVLVRGDHLSSNYAQVKLNIDTIDSFGSTNLRAPITVATNELINYGLVSHVWLEILLTDGDDQVGNSDAQILAEAQRAANNGIVIFTIGLIGSGGVNENLLMQIADLTGGMYMRAQTANDLDAIFQTIGKIVKNLAGYDDDVTDDVPMVSVFLPSYISYVAGSSFPPPNFIGRIGGRTNLQWNVSKLSINETWAADFLCTSSMEGNDLPATSYPDSAVTYVRYDDKRTTIPFPEVLIDVFAPPPTRFPDLVVLSTDIILSPPPPYLEGDSVQIDATIRNIGDNASSPTVARYHDGVPPSPQIGQDRPIASLSVGGAQGVSIVWLASPPGAHQICVVADPDNLVAEKDESNNIACVSVLVQANPVVKPDYAPFQPYPATTVKVGLSSVLNLSVSVMNLGNTTPMEDAALALYNESSSPFAIFEFAPLPPLGGQPRFTAAWPSPAVPGTYPVIANVDYYDNVTEWNETNNIYTWFIDVVPGPVTSLSVGKPRHLASMTYITSRTPLDLFAADRSETGIRCSMYRIDGGSWVNYTKEGQFTIAGEGIHYLEWYSEDYAGNIEETSLAMLVVDDTPPTTSLLFGSPSYLVGSNFVTSSTALTLQAKDEGVMPVGLNKVTYRIDNGNWEDYSDAFFLAGEGRHIVDLKSTDLLDNEEEAKPIQVVVDNTPPVTEPLIGEPKYLVGGNFVTSSTPIALHAEDGGKPPVGLGFTSYRIWDGVWSDWLTYSAEFHLLGQDGPRIIECKSVDLLENIETTRSVSITVDNSPPTTSMVIGEPKYLVRANFVKSSTPIAFNASDRGNPPVGLSLTTFRVWDGEWSEWLPYDSLLRLEGRDGARYVEYSSTDMLGNTEVVARTYLIVDDTPPDLRILPEASTVPNGTFFFIGADDGAGSGVANLEYSLDGNPWGSYSGQFSMSVGVHDIAYRSSDNLGNPSLKYHQVEVASPERPPESPVEFNYKPLVATVFVISLAVVGAWSSRRRPWKDETSRKAVLKAYVIISTPFAVAEVATGVVSLLTGLLAIPPLLGFGTAVDVAILATGLAVAVHWALGKKNTSLSSEASGQVAEQQTGRK